jgi:hypothetical protein
LEAGEDLVEVEPAGEFALKGFGVQSSRTDVLALREHVAELSPVYDSPSQ